MKNVPPFLILLLAQFSSSVCQIIRKYDQNIETINEVTDHLVQISPPGKYRIIIWTNFTQKKFECEENSIFFNVRRLEKNENNENDKILYFSWTTLLWRLEYLSKCFGSFYTVTTDEKGQFLMEKNRTIQNGKTAQNLAMHIIPLNEEVAISDPFAYFAVQKVYSLAKNVPLDSLCNFDDNGNNRKCILNYFETSADKKDAIVSIFDHWSNPLVPLLSKKENFFLFAILQELLNELKQRINNGHKVEGDCEAMLDTFWHYFDGENHPLFDLVKLRLVDEQIVSLIGELCQICQKLHFSSQSLDGQFKKWATLREKMLRFSEPKLALDSFCHWIMPNGAEDQGSADGISKSGEMSEEMRQIVKFWMAILSAKMFSHCSNWTENELIMLRDIGEMIQIVVIGAGNRSKEKIDNLMKAVQSEPEFETICAKLSDFMEDCQPEHRLMLSPWHKIVQKFPGNQNEFVNLFDVQPFERKASSEASESSEASASNCAAKNSKRKVSPKQKEQKGTKGHWSGICSFCHKAEVVSCFVGCRHFVCENCLLNFLDDNCPKCAQKTGNNNNTKSRFLPPKCFQSSAP